MFELHPDENIIMYIRKHWIFLALEILSISIVFIVPVVFFLFLKYSGIVSNFLIFGLGLFTFFDILIYIWAIICWLILAERFVKYSLNFWILTNRRIIESELPALFNRKISTLELADVEDITIEISGFIKTIIGYGTLAVQTAGTQREFVATDIWMPTKVQEAIFSAKLKLKKDEQDIERTEVEQISDRIISNRITENNFSIPSDQTLIGLKNQVIKEEFDWANNVEVEDRYKQNTEKALRIE